MSEQGVAPEEQLRLLRSRSMRALALIRGRLRSPTEWQGNRLDEVCERDEFVDPGTLKQLVSLLDRRSITIGLAGPRGAGKSTLLRRAFQTKADQNKRQRSRMQALVDSIAGLPDYVFPGLSELFAKLGVFLLLSPLFLPLVGDLVWLLFSPNVSRRPRPRPVGGADPALAKVRRRPHRGPVVVEPIPAPTQYVEQQFLQSLFDRELKQAHYNLGEQVPYLRHLPRLGLRGKLAAVAGTLLWLWLFLISSGRPLVNPKVAGLILQAEVAYQMAAVVALGLVGIGLVWMWDNLHRVWPTFRYRAEQRLFLVILARHERLAFAQRLTSSTTTEMTPFAGLFSGLKVGAQSGLELTRQPYTLVGMVEDIREFADEVLAVFDKLYVGIDELDKMYDVDQVRQFLRGIKGIFSIKGVCYVLTVSREAVSSFQLRNLSARDELDSSFREVINVRSLEVDDCGLVLEGRGVKLAPEEKRMLAIISGGNARELFRQANDYLAFKERHSLPGRASPARWASAYFGHIADQEVKSLLENVRSLPFPDQAKIALVRGVQELDSRLGAPVEVIADLAKLPALNQILDQVRRLPYSHYRRGLGATNRDDLAGGAELAAAPAKGGEPAADRQELEFATRLEATALRTTVRVATWRVLASRVRGSLSAASGAGEEWRELVELTAESPLEGAKRLGELAQRRRAPRG